MNKTTRTGVSKANLHWLYDRADIHMFISQIMIEKLLFQDAVNLIEQLCSWFVGGEKILKRGISKNKSNKRRIPTGQCVCWPELNATS